MQRFDFKKYHYHIDYILHYFNLERGTSCAVLDRWLSVKAASNYQLPDLLAQKRIVLEQECDLWNEEELKMLFVSPLFSLINIEVPHKIKLFFERSITTVIDNLPLKIVCDAFLATPIGISTPDKPYFFLQEFKKSKNSHDDAEGQMLLAMLIAQNINADNKPIYGCYLQGRHWYFSTLQDKNYCISKAYDATQTADLVQIIHILESLKHHLT